MAHGRHRPGYRKEYYLNHKVQELKNKREWRKNNVHASLYNIWTDMMSRCFNTKVRSYRWYGSKGITVCSEWLIFDNFKDWALSNGYVVGFTVDRINNNGSYEPNNCQFLSKGDNVRKQFKQRERKV